MTSLCWFTYARDEPLLRLSVESARRAIPFARVCIFDQSGKTISRNTLEVLRPDIYQVTDWPRRGNLNGWPCVDGMLECMATAAGYGKVIKVDSDTMIRGGDWQTDDALVGFSVGRGAWCGGFCYSMTGELISCLRDHLSKFVRDSACPLGEDVLITSHAMAVAKTKTIYPANSYHVSWHPSPPADITIFNGASVSYRARHLAAAAALVSALDK